jgi:large subunit GTPase 1
VIPIDRLTDVRAPAEVIAQRIARPVLEAAYGTRLPRPGPEEDPHRSPFLSPSR